MEQKEAKCQKPRTWLVKGREKLGLDRQAFGRMVGCSQVLIEWLEDGVTITHPNIAARIVHAIGGNVKQYNQLVHRCRRQKELPEVKPVRQADVTEPRACKECGQAFMPTYKLQTYCSVSCASTSSHRKRKWEQERACR